MLKATTRFLLISLLLAGCQQAPVASLPPNAESTVMEGGTQMATQRLNVGVLVFDGVQVIDYSAPFEVFGQAGQNVFTVAKQKAAVTTAMGQSINPRYGFADVPPLDVLVIPGGEVTATQDDPTVQAWIRSVQPRAKHILSVCNGAFILAKTGLLDGKTATTFYGLISELPAAGKNISVVYDKRFVDNGQIVTTSGLTSGMDGALYVISKELGKGTAQQVALNLEYDWRPDFSYARATFADMYIMGALRTPKLAKLLSESAVRVERTEGNARQWTQVLDLQGKSDATEVAQRLAAGLTDAGWQRSATTAPTEGHWTFTDEKGQSWRVQTVVSNVGGGVRLAFRIDAGA